MNVRLLVMALFLFLTKNIQAQEFYKVCCTVGPSVKLYINTFEHNQTAEQYNIRIVGLKGHTTGAGANGVNLPRTGVCAWEDRPVYSNPEQSIEIWASWLSPLTQVQKYTTVFPGKGIETHYKHINDFTTGNFTNPGSTFCVLAKGTVYTGQLEVKSGAMWWINPPSVWGR